MTLSIVRVAGVAPQPWRNGGGTTRELVTWPSAQAWGLRVSVADVERDGPFSAFEGIERWFVVLEGAGVDLRFADSGETTRVVPGDPPLAFDGSRTLHCALVSGATRDLNVMAVTKRGRVRCEPARAGSTAPAGDLRALFAQDRARLLHRGGETALDAMSLAWSTDTRALRLADAGRAWWIAYRARR
jgi:environmental stress-induced protein Ves